MCLWSLEPWTWSHTELWLRTLESLTSESLGLLTLGSLTLGSLTLGSLTLGSLTSESLSQHAFPGHLTLHIAIVALLKFNFIH